MQSILKKNCQADTDTSICEKSPNPDPITLATEKEQWCLN